MRTCCFTGHRSYKLGLNGKEIKALKEKLTELIGRMADKGITEFYTGMAEGVDLWAGAAVLEIQREKPLRLVAAIPFIGQEKGWKKEDKEIYREILKGCDETHLLSSTYYPQCYFYRNEFMVDKSDYVLAVYNGSGGGTKYTMDYALKKGKMVIALNPKTLTATYLKPE